MSIYSRRGVESEPRRVGGVCFGSDGGRRGWGTAVEIDSWYQAVHDGYMYEATKEKPEF